MPDTLTDVQVSVIVAAYNATRTIDRAIQSVVEQTLGEWEMIVVNDASTDDTEQRVRAWSQRDARVKLISLDRNSRQSAARNEAIRHARGEWIAILDADDAFEPERLDTLVREAVTANLDMIADNQKFYDMTAGRVSRTAMPLEPRIQDWTLLKMFEREKVGVMFKWGLLKPLIRKRYLLEKNISYNQGFHMGEDCLLYAEALVKGARAAVLGAPMYIYTTARGELTGEGSGVSTSKYNIDDHLTTFNYFRGMYQELLSSAVLRAISRVERSAYTSEAANRFKADLRRGNIRRALTEILRYPDMLEQFAVTIWKRIRYRLLYQLLNRRSSSLTPGSGRI